MKKKVQYWGYTYDVTIDQNSSSGTPTVTEHGRCFKNNLSYSWIFPINKFYISLN